MRQKGFAPILIILVALIAIGGAYYFVKQKGNILNTLTPVPSPIANVIPTQATLTTKPTANPTANLTPKPTVLPVSLYSTNGWTMVGNKKIGFYFPSDRFKISINSDDVIQLKLISTAENNLVGSPNFSIPNDYDGGSRRQWYINHYSYYASEVGKNIFFTEKTLGKIDALEVRLKDSTVITSILVSSGNTLVEVRTQDAELKLVETMVSTLFFK